MECPFCGSTQIMVTNSRPTMGSSQIWRRRRCLECGGSFTTYEKVDLSHLIVIKKSGKRQKYNRAKLFSGIYHSAMDKKGADRGDMGQFSEEITRKVEQEVLKMKRKKVHSSEITVIVLKTLSRKDRSVFLRFLAYREGGDKKRMNQLMKKYF